MAEGVKRAVRASQGPTAPLEGEPAPWHERAAAFEMAVMAIPAQRARPRPRRCLFGHREDRDPGCNE
jgi:hypothetical protein